MNSVQADPTATERLAPVKAVCVRDLVRQRVGDTPDRWHLALVQRALVWDEVRMRSLLDSLLAGYPIGSLLVCQVTGQSRVMRIDDEQRQAAEAASNVWQLVDGQQRINALFSIFTHKAGFGRFYLDMTVRRPAAAGPVTRRRAKDQGLQYIQWYDTGEVPNGRRSNWLDLARWYEWAETAGGRDFAVLTEDLRSGSVDVVSVLNEIDPDFADQLDPSALQIAGESLLRLIQVWIEPSIPVQHLALGSPLDLLEVFTRINRGGVQVAGDDLFFAAVKTWWPEAERVIAGIERVLVPATDDTVDPLIGRMTILRILTRLAARAVQQPDIIPLTVDRLTGPRGDAVIDVMEQLDEKSGPVQRMKLLTTVLTSESSLGFGLYSVDDRLWDDVFAWAAVCQGTDQAWLIENVPAIDAYLIGATAFQYPTILRDRFARVAMAQALSAGVKGEVFPTRGIAEAAREAIQSLQSRRLRIRELKNDEDRLQLADSNYSLFLSLLQGIPYRPQRSQFDWDHIYPQAQATRMSSLASETNRRVHHRYRRFVNSAGNLWGLHFSINRAVQDKMPADKFAYIAGLAAGKDNHLVWPSHRWWLEPSEVEEFKEIGKKLEAGDVEPAMEDFHRLVTGRARRTVDEVFRRLPVAALFSGDSGIAPVDAVQPPEIAAPLGIVVEGAGETRSATPLVPKAPPTAGDRLERFFQYAETTGTSALRQFAQTAVDLGLQVRPYRFTLTVTPPRTKAIALIALTPDDRQRGTVRTWVAPWAFAQHFHDMPAELFDAKLGGIRGRPLNAEQLNELELTLRGLFRQA